MLLSYDIFTEAFLMKVTEYNLVLMSPDSRVAIVDSYMRRALAQFQHVCKYDLTHGDDARREIWVDESIPRVDLMEIVDIVTDGMVYQWLKQYVNKQENLENMLNTQDFSSYSPAELTKQLNAAYNIAYKRFFDGCNHYSYNHGDLTDLHI